MTGKNIIKNLFLLLLLMLPSTVIAQTSTLSDEEHTIQQRLLNENYNNVESCQRGMTSCESMRTDPAKYWSCMKKTCTEIKPCAIGQKKCDPLRDHLPSYWNCMKYTCENPPLEKPNCTKGRETCRMKQKYYKMCRYLVCQREHGYKDNTCEEANDRCSNSLKNFWRCVYNICIGDPEKYRVEMSEEEIQQKIEAEKRKEEREKAERLERDKQFMNSPEMKAAKEKYLNSPEYQNLMKAIENIKRQGGVK